MIRMQTQTLLKLPLMWNRTQILNKSSTPIKQIKLKIILFIFYAWLYIS